jgi:hypothetical protein
MATFSDWFPDAVGSDFSPGVTYLAKYVVARF